jgi:hypothetical protein
LIYDSILIIGDYFVSKYFLFAKNAPLCLKSANPIYTKITRKNFQKKRLAIMLKLRLSGGVLRTDGLDLSYNV